MRKEAYSEKLDDLLKDGMSKKFASYYLSLAVKEYDNPLYEKKYQQYIKLYKALKKEGF